MKNFDGFKSFKGWSEAHCIQQLCKWLDKKGYWDDCFLNWSMYADEMLSEEDNDKSDTGYFYEKGNGVSAVGEKKFIRRFEISNAKEGDVYNDFQTEVKFYISIKIEVYEELQNKC